MQNSKKKSSRPSKIAARFRFRSIFLGKQKPVVLQILKTLLSPHVMKHRDKYKKKFSKKISKCVSKKESISPLKLMELNKNILFYKKKQQNLFEVVFNTKKYISQGFHCRRSSPWRPLIYQKNIKSALFVGNVLNITEKLGVYKKQIRRQRRKVIVFDKIKCPGFLHDFDDIVSLTNLWLFRKLLSVFQIKYTKHVRNKENKKKSKKYKL